MRLLSMADFYNFTFQPNFHIWRDFNVKFNCQQMNWTDTDNDSVMDIGERAGFRLILASSLSNVPMEITSDEDIGSDSIINYDGYLNADGEHMTSLAFEGLREEVTDENSEVEFKYYYKPIYLDFHENDGGFIITVAGTSNEGENVISDNTDITLSMLGDSPQDLEAIFIGTDESDPYIIAYAKASNSVKVRDVLSIPLDTQILSVGVDEYDEYQ